MASWASVPSETWVPPSSSIWTVRPSRTSFSSGDSAAGSPIDARASIAAATTSGSEWLR